MGRHLRLVRLMQSGCLPHRPLLGLGTDLCRYRRACHRTARIHRDGIILTPIPARLGLYGFMEGEELTPGVAELPAEVIQEVRDLMAHNTRR